MSRGTQRWRAVWPGGWWRRLGLGVALALGATCAPAHLGGSVGLATITVSGQTIRYNVQLNTGALPARLADAMRLGDPVLAPDYAPLLDAVAGHVHMRVDDTPCAAVPAETTAARDIPATVDVLIHFACATAPGALTIRDDLFDVLGADHHTIANIQTATSAQQFVFEPDARELRMSVTAPHAEGWWEPRKVALATALALVVGCVLVAKRRRAR